MKKSTIIALILLCLSGCASMREFNKPTVDEHGNREFRATASYARGH